MRADLAVTRVRHAVKRRSCEVTNVVNVTPHLVRITLASDELRDFQSQSFDDHVKVFFPEDGADTPIARDFTPRRHDPTAGELDLEFVLHDTGPATRWAAHARPGHQLSIGGPRGSMIIPATFDWHLLIGDETALPAIARRLEELPAEVRAIVMLEVNSTEDEIHFNSRSQLQVSWCHRSTGGSSALLTQLKSLARLPSGEGYAWAAAESSDVREIRHHLLELGLDKSRIRAASYWKRGAPATHEVIDD